MNSDLKNQLMYPSSPDLVGYLYAGTIALGGLMGYRAGTYSVSSVLR